MLKTAAAAAGAAFLSGLVLAHTAPDDRARYVASARALLEGTGTRPADPQPIVMPQPHSSPVGFNTTALDADAGGQFHTRMEVRGRLLPVMVDTGATLVALSYGDAASIGIHPSEADFKYAVSTANGTARVAAVVLESVRVGNVEARNVPAVVSSPGALTTSNLLGMSFLKKLSGFQVDAGRLVLRQ